MDTIHSHLFTFTVWARVVSCLKAISILTIQTKLCLINNKHMHIKNTCMCEHTWPHSGACNCCAQKATSSRAHVRKFKQSAMPKTVRENSIEIPDTGWSLTPNITVCTHTYVVRQMGGIQTNLAQIPIHGTYCTAALMHWQTDAHRHRHMPTKITQRHNHASS